MKHRMKRFWGCTPKQNFTSPALSPLVLHLFLINGFSREKKKGGKRKGERKEREERRAAGAQPAYSTVGLARATCRVAGRERKKSKDAFVALRTRLSRRKLLESACSIHVDGCCFFQDTSCRRNERRGCLVCDSLEQQGQGRRGSGQQ